MLAFGYQSRYFNLLVEMVVLLRICKLFAFVGTWKRFLEMFVRISSAIGKVGLRTSRHSRRTRRCAGCIAAA